MARREHQQYTTGDAESGKNRFSISEHEQRPGQAPGALPWFLEPDPRTGQPGTQLGEMERKRRTQRSVL